MYRLFNLKYNKYMCYLKTPTIQGSYTTLLLDEDSPLNPSYVWDKVPFEEGFTLRAPDVDASLILIGANPSDQAGATVAWVADFNYQPPIPLLYSDDDKLISLTTGPMFLSGATDDPYTYFVLGREDQWEFQPI
nr:MULTISPECIES: hypothetical protein [unclassified Ochrobactrum]